MKFYRNINSDVNLCTFIFWFLSLPPKWVIYPWIVKNEFFKFVSHVTKKPFNLHSWNFIGLSMVIQTCALSYFGFHLRHQTWVICPWFVKNEVFKFVTHVTKNPFNLHSWNFIGLSMVMLTCAPPYFGFHQNEWSALELKN